MVFGDRVGKDHSTSRSIDIIECNGARSLATAAVPPLSTIMISVIEIDNKLHVSPAWALVDQAVTSFGELIGH